MRKSKYTVEFAQEVVKHVYDGKTYAETAQILNIPRKEVYILFNRELKRRAVIQMYDAGYSINYIAKKYEMSINGVCEVLEQAGL